MARGVVRRGALGALALLAGAVAACGPRERQPIRLWTDHFEFRVTMDPTPPHANEPTIFRVVVLDRETRQPVEGGEGQVFATSEDRVNKFDSFVAAPEAGTYTARMTFVTAGDWHVNLRFRRDSTSAIEKPVEDWVQTVGAPRPPDQRPYK
ncbi:FixH family protein [Roseisolibacter sp. H3M3-2]|uniref:FixH family protein n=1 Tax=Roseisolibacter sp. H3M3-2 TaxID=3031323 RepID=UPI0023DC5A38|nr:FixH family protein [Roseisolibacter sp. H3M3-2]MDF1502987.1 FixH family protein [Roseisolibacter sp. H3M3-2]